MLMPAEPKWCIAWFTHYFFGFFEARYNYTKFQYCRKCVRDWGPFYLSSASSLILILRSKLTQEQQASSRSLDTMHPKWSNDLLFVSNMRYGCQIWGQYFHILLKEIEELKTKQLITAILKQANRTLKIFSIS